MRHSWDCCSLPRPESLPFCPLPSLSLPSPYHAPASTTQKASPFLSLSQSHTSVPLHNPVPWSGHLLCLCLCLVSATQGNATLTGQLAQLPCPPISQQPLEVGLGISLFAAVHYLDSPISFRGFCLTNGFTSGSAPSSSGSSAQPSSLLIWKEQGHPDGVPGLPFAP